MLLVFAVLFALQCASATIILDCRYSVEVWYIVGTAYTCEPRVNRLDDSPNVVEVSQNHMSGKSNNDVRVLWFSTQKLEFIPKDIGLFFENLEVLDFYSNPIKSFSKDDLKPFSKLKVLNIFNGQLKTISGDAFVYSPQLRYVTFTDNSITNVGPGLLQSAPLLTHAYFSNNLCISTNAANNSTAVASLAKQLAFKCPPTVEMIEKIILEGENFEEAVQNQFEPELAAVDDQFTAFNKRFEQLEADNKEASERIEELEKFILSLCASHSICA